MTEIEKLIEELEITLGKAEEKETVSEEEVKEEAVPEEIVKEDEVVDVAPEAEVALEEPKEEPEEPAFNDTMSLADTFDAKARIARALEALQDAVEEFKNATADKVDLIKDAVLINTIEGLDLAVEAIVQALAAGELLKSDLNDPFNAELPDVEETEATEEVAEEKTEETAPNTVVYVDASGNEEEMSQEAFDYETGKKSFADFAGLDMIKDTEAEV